jgi:hypothetical protein
LENMNLYDKPQVLCFLFTPHTLPWIVCSKPAS